MVFIQIGSLVFGDETAFLIRDSGNYLSDERYVIEDLITVLKYDKVGNIIQAKMSDGMIKDDINPEDIAFPIISKHIKSDTYKNIIKFQSENIILAEYGDHNQNFLDSSSDETLLFTILKRNEKYYIINIGLGPNSIIMLRNSIDFDRDGFNDIEIETFGYSNTDPSISSRYKIISYNQNVGRIFSVNTFLLSHEFEIIMRKFKVNGGRIIQESVYTQYQSDDDNGESGLNWMEVLHYTTSEFYFENGKLIEKDGSLEKKKIMLAVNDNNVRIRNNPSLLNGEIIGKINKGEKFELLKVVTIYKNELIDEPISKLKEIEKNGSTR
jgi:hypothetical protein